MTPNRLARSALAACAVALAAVSFAPAASAAKKKDKDPTLKVMTRNIYLGGNIFLPIGAPDRATFEAKTQELWNQIRFTNFPARAKLLAKEVKRTKPDLIGLQEVATWRRSPNGVKDGSATPSTQVVYDFLKTLNAALKAEGLKYRVAIAQQEADIEAPTQQYDVRLSMRDVILVRTGKGAPKLTAKRGRQFQGRHRRAGADRGGHQQARLDLGRGLAEGPQVPVREHPPGGRRRGTAGGPGQGAGGQAAAPRGRGGRRSWSVT